jgi:kynurenine formamidase
LGATAKKAVWASNRLPRFLKANLNVYRKAFSFPDLPLHVDFLWNRGAYIIEILNLDDLAKDQAYEFLFVLSPLLLRGGIGVPVNPIAIR